MVGCLLGISLLGQAVAQNQSRLSANKSSASCVQDAAKFHKVNAQILAAILVVESGLRATAIGRNADGSVDFGIAQINSRHFAELGKFGIAPDDLFSPCIGTYVAAWHLAKQYRRYGNTWFAVGAYHSVTPEHNLKYQRLVFNEIARNYDQFPTLSH